jgi:hypothetical protein
LFGWFGKAGAAIGLNVSEIGLLLVSAVVAAGLIGEYRKKKDERWLGLSDVFELLVIVGVVGEIFFDGLIFGFSERLTVIQDEAVETATTSAGQAGKVAGAAYERAAKLENENLKLRQQMAGQGGRISAVENKTADRDIDSGQRHTIRRNINGHRRPVTIVRLDEREAYTFAGKLDEALTAAHFAVTKVDFGHTSPLTGVIVCENGGAEVKLFEALKAADITAERRASTDKYVQDHPPECQTDFAHATAIRIFVGQRK